MRPAACAAIVLLGLLMAGCTEQAAAPRVDRFVAVVANQPDAESGDLLDESLTVLCFLEPMPSGPAESFQLEPGESKTFEFPVGDLDEFGFNCSARSMSGASATAQADFTQANCGSLDSVHLDVRFFAKLTTGTWKWGADWEEPC